MTLEEEIAGGESKALEFKQELPGSDAVARTVVAFSNTSGGKLVIGVNDERKIVGIDPEEDVYRLKDAVASIIYDLCYPNIIPDITSPTLHGKTLLVVAVPRGDLMPYFVKKDGLANGVYLRIGATVRKASEANILAMIRERDPASFDSQIDTRYALDDLDLSNLTARFAATAHGNLSPERLVRLGLAREENGQLYPTRALLILLGLYENVVLHCAAPDDRKAFSGDLFEQLANAENFVKAHTGKSIPNEAVHEALVNALLHRDYTAGQPVQVNVNDRSVDVASPGGLPNAMTPQDLKDGASGTRNKSLSRVFRELGYARQWGDGFNRMRSACNGLGFEAPKVHADKDRVVLEFKRKQ